MAARAARRSRELRNYIAIFRRWLWLLCLCTVVAGLGAFVVSKLQPPIYRATTLLIVDQNTSNADPYSSLLASDQLVETYMSLINQPAVLQPVATQFGITEKNLANSVSVSNPGTSTQIIEVQVDDQSPVRAAGLANAIANEFVQLQVQTTAAEFQDATQQIDKQITTVQQQITTLNSQISALQATNPANPQIQTLKSQVNDATQNLATLESTSAQLSAQALVDSHNIRVFELATPPKQPDHPVIRTNVAIGAAGGLMLAIGLALLFELLNVRIRTPEQAQELTGLPVIGRATAQSHDRALLSAAKGSHLKDSFSVLLTNLSFIRLTKPLRTIMVTSAVPGEGKSTVTINLAIALARSGKRVLLLDADIRLPRVHRYLGISNAGGLTLFLMQGQQPIRIENWKDAYIDNLYVLTAGPTPPNPLELLGSDLFKGFLKALTTPNAQGQTMVDVVVIDTPPVCTFPDAAVLAQSVDGTILVVDRLRSRDEAVQRAQDALEQVQARIIGVFFNHARRQQDTAYEYQEYGKQLETFEHAAIRAQQESPGPVPVEQSDTVLLPRQAEGAAAHRTAVPVERAETARLPPRQ